LSTIFPFVQVQGLSASGGFKAMKYLKTGPPQIWRTANTSGTAGGLPWINCDAWHLRLAMEVTGNLDQAGLYH